MIPGWFVALLTFPGVILHEWAHKSFCDYFRIPVFEVCYFRFGQRESGYVKHGEPKSFSQAFWISTAPLIINSLIAVFLAAATTQARDDSTLQLVLGWLSVSAAMHAFPSDHDADQVLGAARAAKASGHLVPYILAYPFVELIAFANAARFIWVDAAYAFILFQAGVQITKVVPG